MATKFDDILKGPKDLLSDDYTDAISLKCKKSAGPVSVTIETNRDGAGALSSKIGTKFSYAGFNVDKAQHKADGGRVLESSVEVSPGYKVSFKANKGADLHLDYNVGSLYATGVLDVMDLSKLSATACYSHHCGAKVGTALVYGLKGAGLTGFDVGVSYGKGPAFAAVTTSAKFSKYNLGLLYKVNGDLSLASQTSHASLSSCDFGGLGCLYKAPFGTVKAKYCGKGMVSACLIKEVAPKVKVTASGAVSASDLSNFKTGLGIEI
jgi:voltage-dependent anion channel protein 2